MQLPWWQAEVVFHGRVMGQGGSFERRGAEQAAARQALQQLGQLEAGLG
jgi:dsRNA-specific ribonuclease